MNGSSENLFPDILSSRLEDLYGAPLPGEEAPLYREALGKTRTQLLELIPEEGLGEARTLLTEMEKLSERLRRLYVRFSYLQGLQDGSTLREVIGGQS
jgi:hypothetical protein